MAHVTAGPRRKPGPVAVAVRWLFSRPASVDEDALEIIGWWEFRRIPYNIFLALIGIPSLILFFAFILASGELEPGEDAVEPIAIMAAPFLFNICYSAGWVCELALRVIGLRGAGPTLLILGVGFSVLLLLAPAIFWGLFVLVQMLAG